tara:strand:+ start:176 stop:451 length:276 start_codon:yes stop_codon:yes gene_type:complete
MWETSNFPTAFRTQLCSAIMDPNLMGIFHPPKVVNLAPDCSWDAISGDNRGSMTSNYMWAVSLLYVWVRQGSIKIIELKMGRIARHIHFKL